MQMQCLVYGPIKAAAEHSPMGSLGGRPFLIVIDGVDECEDKEEIQDFIDGMLAFFDENPFVPLRVFITSRVEQHIQSLLNVPGVHLDNLVDHCSDEDIATFLDVLFEDGRRRSPVIQAYVKQHGEWPTPNDRRKLVEHIGGSFIFASAVFKFIMGSNAEDAQPTTPMDRLPLALKMNPGLDGLYAQTLARSEHLPHFFDIVSTVALLEKPLPISGIAELLAIHTYEVVNVLVNLQAIIQVPGTDNIPVTLCHTSLRDFLTAQSQAGRFFAHPRHHVSLSLRCLDCGLKFRGQMPGLLNHPTQCTPGVAYALRHSLAHLHRGEGHFKLTESDSAVELCREALVLHPGAPELIRLLASVTQSRSRHTGSLLDLGEAVTLYRKVLELRPSPNPVRSMSLNNLSSALLERYWRTGTMADLEEATSLYREALELQPSPNPARSWSLNNIGSALLDRYQRKGTMADLEEAISLFRQALDLRPSRHPDRSSSLNNLGNALLDRHRHTGTTADLEEAISLHYEALDLRPSPHPDRSSSLNNFGNALLYRYQRTGTMADLEEAISLQREALELRPSPHPDRSMSLNNLGNALLDRYRRTGTMTDLEEAISLHREALDLRPSPHPDRSRSLTHLANVLQSLYECNGSIGTLTEAISLHREALGLRPATHPGRLKSLRSLSQVLQSQFEQNGNTGRVWSIA
ncbi:hypothetical protein EST38_g11852 [Candolleomyces aberdarensis]|uniref:Nephrocystin 3-like N-terminal domain-containing protein n=1 Tax=Candolleomyces aberdarensis TaxID=2316362 RepID=A0A4Q2D5E0_9AGAR|nr:hypothetical protein EST38_g11852 [Candolleomyces aberdarensis]